MELDQKRILNTRNITFFVAETLLALIGAPIYIYYNGIAAVEIWLFMVGYVATSLAITVGYHRYFAHRAFKVHPFFRLFVLFFGAAAFQESVYQWASQHRAHHRYADTTKDPYNIKQGFFYAHIGWLLYRRHQIDYSNATDLAKDKLILHQHKYFVIWATISGILLPTLIGALWGHALGGFLIGAAGRLCFVHQGTFMINSVCHYFGKPNYDRASSPKDHWVVALITNGEGYHSYHHRFPSDYRNGVKWYHWDPSKWFIALMARVGFASDLKRASQFQILSARLVADRESVEHSVLEIPKTFQGAALEALKIRYEGIKDVLHQWEQSVKEHAEICKQGLKKSDAIRAGALTRVRQARKNFLSLQSQWTQFIDQPVLKLAFGS